MTRKKNKKNNGNITALIIILVTSFIIIIWGCTTIIGELSIDYSKMECAGFECFGGPIIPIFYSLILIIPAIITFIISLIALSKKVEIK